MLTVSVWKTHHAAMGRQMVGAAVTLVVGGGLVIRAQAPAIPPPGSKTPVSGYTVVRTYPHDPKAFTQGLEYHDGFLYEGTGLKGQSAIRKVELETGKVVQEEKINPACSPCSPW